MNSINYIDMAKSKKLLTRLPKKCNCEICLKLKKIVKSELGDVKFKVLCNQLDICTK